MKLNATASLLISSLFVAAILHSAQAYSGFNRKYEGGGGVLSFEDGSPAAQWAHEVFGRKKIYPPVQGTSVKEANAPGVYSCDGWGNRRVNRFQWEKC